MSTAETAETVETAETSESSESGVGGPAIGQTASVATESRREGERREGERSTSSTRGAGVTWDADVIKDVLVRWFRPLREREGWLALAYLFVGFVAAIAFFVAVQVVGWTVFGLAFVFVGLLFVVPAFDMVNAFARAEKAMAAWAGLTLELREPRPVPEFGLRSMKVAITDPVRWRQVAFMTANIVMAPVLYTLGVIPYAVLAELLLGWNVLPFGALDFRGGGAVLALPVAVGLLGAGPRAARWVAAIKVDVARWFLGPDRLAEAEARVTTLAEQRQDILDAVASERRRIERNLHDGVQQQLVAVGIDLGMAAGHIEDDPTVARELLAQARLKLQESIGELRQLGRGLHPAILVDRGLDAALSAVVASAPMPISVHVDPDIDVSANLSETLYFVVNEAVANILKHAKARVASVHVARIGDIVRVTVHDDGRGGADQSRGTGLAGIRARVRGMDGTLMVSSPPGGPTTLIAELPRHG